MGQGGQHGLKEVSPSPTKPEPRVLPDAALGVPEDGGGEALRHPDQAGAIHLHDEIVHLDPEDKGIVAVGPPLAHLPGISHPGEHLAHLAAPNTSPSTTTQARGWAAAGTQVGVPRPGSPYLPSRWAAPPSVTVLTKMPSFSRPMSAPAPMPMMLIPSPRESAGMESHVLVGWQRPPNADGVTSNPPPRCQQGVRTHLSPTPRGRGQAAPPSSPARTRPTRPWGQRLRCGGHSLRWSKC